MVKFLTTLLALGWLSLTTLSVNVVRFSMVEEEQLAKSFGMFGVQNKFRENFLNSRRQLSRPVMKQGKSPLYVSAFQWKNCGAPDKESLVIEKFSISPDPIVIPGTLTTNLIATFNQTVDAPLQADVVLEREVLDVWIRIPCINNVGSCTYPDLCDNLSTITCPLSFVQQKVPCQCPFRKGTYMLTNGDVEIKVGGPVPVGTYRVTANLTVSGQFIACYSVIVTITE